MTIRARLLVAALLLVATAPAAATESAARTRYDAAFFTPYAPMNALQMIERVPGFTLEVGDSELRGFGQAAGNVVINGQRPSSKSETLDDVLARVPASRVARIEIGPGDLFGTEFAGKPMVANLVLSDTSGLAGTASARVARSYAGEVLPEANLSIMTKFGTSSFNVSAGFEDDHSTEEGSDTLRALPERQLVEFRRKINRMGNPNGYLSASWAHDGGTDKTAHLNTRVALARFKLTQANSVFPAEGDARSDQLAQRFNSENYELGGDVTRPLLGGGLKLVGLYSRRDRDNRETSLFGIDGGSDGGFAQDLADRRDEALARLAWSRTGLAGWTVETGGELAYNSLDSRVDLYEIDSADTRTRIDLPVDSAKVAEWRGELFINGGRAIAPALRIDLGLTYEASRLSVTGDAQAERSLRFLKPKATLDWNRKGSWHIQLSAARSVAQLQFEDFISAAELSTDRVNGGNAELVPQRAWEMMLTAEHPFLRDGLVKIELGYNAIEKVQDRVPTPEGYDAPGNLGDGRELIARGTIDAPLGPLGIKGGRLSARLSLVDTSVVDPYTLRPRSFSGNALWAFNTSFRQDLGAFAWGVTFEGNAASTSYRRTELDSVQAKVPYVSLFGEYRPDARTRLTLGIDNLLDMPATRDRRFFSPDRGTATPVLHEYRERNQHILPYLSLKRDFG